MGKGVITMLLQDNGKRQVILEKDPLTKEFSVIVYNKSTQEKTTYRSQKMMHKLICECI